MIAFIDDHRGAYGVEPICRVLPISPSTYHAHLAKRADAGRLSARVRRDAALKREVRRVFEENFRVYGVRKVWRQMQREGFDVARCTVARLMRALGLKGVIRGRQIATTVSDKAVPPTRPREPTIPGTTAERTLGLGLQCAAASGVGDEGRSLAIVLQEQVANHRMRRGSKARVVSVTEKAP